MSGHDFPQALQLTVAHEGLFSNNPKDPGGATMKGVTQVVYDHYRTNKSLPLQSVQLIDEGELHEIYKAQYWDTVSGDRLASGLDYALFDYAVNSGPERAIKDLQRCIGAGVDGQMGEQTVAMACAVNDVDSLIIALCDRRLAFLKTLRTWSTFGKGWTRRIEGDTDGAQSGDNGVVDLAVMMHDAPGSGGPLTQAALAAIPLPSAIGSKPGEVAGKGAPADVAVTKTPQGKGVIATAAGIGATAITTIGNLATQTQPVADNAQKIAGAAVQFHDAAHKVFGIFDKMTFEVLTGGSLLLSLGGCAFFGWHYLQSQREKAVK